ncbi:MAG: MarR family transcriptional regulator [Rhizobiaceae bacterium]|nr:MarR family transcriptional regulator [Rhizobiaceae bacterium]
MAKKIQIGLGKRLRLAHMAFSRGLRMELAKENVSFGQFVHLERLWEKDGLTQKELSGRVGVEMASSTVILAELETLGLVRRERSEQDRRAINVFLTPEGKALKSRLLKCAGRVNALARKALSPEQVDLVMAALDIVAKEMNEHYPQSGRSGKQRLQA